MDEQQLPAMPNPFTHSMKYGLVLGVCFGVAFILSAIGITGLGVLSWLIQISTLYLVWLFTRNYRETECGGTMRFMQAWSYVLLLFFFAALVGGIIKFFYLQYIAPGYLGETLSQSLLLLEQMQIEFSSEQIDLLQSMMTPINYVFQAIMGDCFLGLFLGLFYGLILKRK